MQEVDGLRDKDYKNISTLERRVAMTVRRFERIHVMTHEDSKQLTRPLDERYTAKTVFECSVCPNPEKFWADDIRMIRYLYGQQQKLIDLGLADDDFFASLQERSDSFVVLAIEVAAGSLKLDYLFEMAMSMQLVDIYLYKDGKLLMKYD